MTAKLETVPSADGTDWLGRLENTAHQTIRYSETPIARKGIENRLTAVGAPRVELSELDVRRDYLSPGAKPLV